MWNRLPQHAMVAAMVYIAGGFTHYKKISAKNNLNLVFAQAISGSVAPRRKD
jgi:hypothetical protein